MRQGRVCAAGGKELRVRGASMILPTHWAPERRGPRWSPSSLHLSVHSSGPCLLRTAHQRWKVSCLGPGGGGGAGGVGAQLAKSSPPGPLQRMGRVGKGGCRLILSWGESANWLTPWPTELAGPERSPHCDPEA